MNKKIETDVKTDEIILAPSSEETTSSVEESVPICAKKDMVKKERRRVSEIRELRAPNKKVFEMNDGTKEAVIYPHPVHILDEETGTYADVDATLEMKDGEKLKLIADQIQEATGVRVRLRAVSEERQKVQSADLSDIMNQVHTDVNWRN